MEDVDFFAFKLVKSEVASVDLMFLLAQFFDGLANLT